jgi:fluoride ion exporter CrcB/FEX
MRAYLLVFLGGGIGSALRHGFNGLFARLIGTTFPHATLFENLTGSFLMGILAGYFAFGAQLSPVRPSKGADKALQALPFSSAGDRPPLGNDNRWVHMWR